MQVISPNSQTISQKALHSTIKAMMKRYLITWILLIIQYFSMEMESQVLSSSNSSHTSSIPPSLYLEEQCLILLQFKNNFTINKSLASVCGKYELSDPKTESWNKKSTNCCTWNGVTCDEQTGDVIGINLSCSQLSGKFHQNITLFQLPRLSHLNLAFNDFKQSPIPSSISMLAPTITHLILSTSSFQGPIPLELAYLSKLVNLDLSGNVGLLFHNYPLNSLSFNYMIRNLTHLENLNLNYVNMSCTIPDSIVNLTSLRSLQLKENGLYGEVHYGVFNLPALENLLIWKNHGLNGNFNNVNWNTNEKTSSLKYLLLSHVSFSGGLPDSIGHLSSLKSLRIEYCNITGSLTHSIGNLSQLIGLSLRSNNFTGHLPPSMCNMTSLMILDLSTNRFMGTIPPCLGTFSANISVIDLRKNDLHGGIPDICAKDNKLLILSLSENQLQGPIPVSLSRCNLLQVLGLGFNMINGTFPSWLDGLPNLQSLVLMSNMFQGSIDNSTTPSPFPKLRIFDISHNQFTGDLPSWYFKNFNAMKKVANEISRISTRSMDLYSAFKNSDMSIEYKYVDSITITMSGSCLTHVESGFLNQTRIDLSRNKFEGPIPFMGELTQLTELKLSNNHLSGEIPVSLSKLVGLQSLDLSLNHLIGEIPQELTSLSYLQALNLSCNRLKGRIPHGAQFEFSNSSYIDNMELCGPPLSRKCQEYEIPTLNDSEDDSDAWIGFTWQIVLMGYAVGLLIGIAVCCVSFNAGRPKWLVTMVEEQGKKILKKYK